MTPADVIAWHRAEAAAYRQRAQNARVAAQRYPSTADMGSAVAGARHRGVAMAADRIADRHDAMATAVDQIVGNAEV